MGSQYSKTRSSGRMVASHARLVRRRHTDRQPGGYHASSAEGPGRGGPDRRRGHPGHPKALGALRHTHPAHQLPRAQQASEASVAPGRPPTEGPGPRLRRRNSRRQRPWLRAGAGCRRSRGPRAVGARSVGCDLRGRGVWADGQPVRLPGVPSQAARRAPAPVDVDGGGGPHHGGLGNAAQTSSVPGRPPGDAGRPPGCRSPRADQAPRGGLPRTPLPVRRSVSRSPGASSPWS